MENTTGTRSADEIREYLAQKDRSELESSQRSTTAASIIVFVVIAVVLALLFWAAWRQYTSQRARDARPRICPNPNCGYSGVMEAKTQGSGMALALLLIAGVIPGLIYMVLMGGRKFCCPRCLMRIDSSG